MTSRVLRIEEELRVLQVEREILGLRHYDKILNAGEESTYGYWPMWEPSGDSVSKDYSGKGNDGAYANVTLGEAGIGDGRSCALFNGTTSENDVFSAGLAADFDGEEGTFTAWVKALNLAVWRDSTIDTIARFQVDINNRVFIDKTTTNDQLRFWYAAGGTVETILTTLYTAAWFHIAFRWSKSDDAVEAFVNGSSVGSSSALGTWSGTIVQADIGNDDSAYEWNGWLAHAAIRASALSDADIADLAVV